MNGKAGVDLQTVERALSTANIPENVWETKGAGLEAAERQLYRRILRAFPEIGGAPGPDRVRVEAESLGLEPEAALGALASRDLIVRDHATGAITVAYPFSAVPTPHWVEAAGSRPVYAMCAVDALGIPFMLDRDAIIVSTDPTSGEPIRVEVLAGKGNWDPSGSVVFVCKLRDCKGPDCCTVINFFRSAEAAEAYRRFHPDTDGIVLAHAEALEAGRRVFGDLLLESGSAERGDFPSG